MIYIYIYEACHRFGKPDQQKSKKMVIIFINQKNEKNVLFSKKKLKI